MDKIAEELPKSERVEQFNSDNFHEYLLTSEKPPDLLPGMIDLSFYTPRFGEMYDTQNLVAEWEDLSIPLEQRLKSRKTFQVAAERGCTSYVDPQTMSIQLTPIMHGTEQSVTRESFYLVNQNKLPLVEIHTHPQETLFSAQDYATLLIRSGDHHFMKAAILLCPGSQILALASSETAKFDSEELVQMLYDWDEKNKREGSQFITNAKSEESLNSARLHRAVSRLDKLLHTGKYSPDRILKKADDLGNKANDFTFRQSEASSKKLAIWGNQTLLGFAHTNSIKLYSSTDRRFFREFSA